jgi:hypothetical protein
LDSTKDRCEQEKRYSTVEQLNMQEEGNGSEKELPDQTLFTDDFIDDKQYL